MRNYSRFDEFITTISKSVYPETLVEPHATITRNTISVLFNENIISSESIILDVGCGQGFALECFRTGGAKAIGITLGEDVDICLEKGYDVRRMDQNFMDFPDCHFDFLWCRHVLEHSLAPFFTLSEYHRILKPNSFAYVEVPAPDTDAHHENNPNHYSVLTLSSWKSLFERVHLDIERSFEYNFKSQIGKDLYYGFILKKIDTPS